MTVKSGNDGILFNLIKPSGGGAALSGSILDGSILNVPREMFSFYGVFATQHEGKFNNVFQLPNISRKIVVHQNIQCVVGYAFDFLADYDLTESSTIAAAGGLFGDSTPLSTLTVGDVDFAALAIPDDTSITTDDLLVGTEGTQYFAIGGDVASAVAAAPILTGDTSGNSEKSITLKVPKNLLEE